MVAAAHAEVAVAQPEARGQHVVQRRLQPDLHPDWILTLLVYPEPPAARHKLQHLQPLALDVVVQHKVVRRAERLRRQTAC